jgi:glucokinase
MSGLIADIGGTNARFAAVDSGEIKDVEVLACADYPSLTDAAKAYLAKYKRNADRAVFAVAAPIMGDEIKMINHTWTMSKKKVQSDLGFKSFEIINDFTAIAHGIPRLTPADYYQIGEGSPKKGAPISIIGPGTGLGVAGVVFDENGKPIPITTEGGHVTMHAQTEREWSIIKYLKETKYTHVSAERLVSGKGLLNVYQSLCGIDGKTANKTDPSEITQAALDKSCATCVETLDLFVSMLATLAGNHAMSMGAFGGVYIAGGIPPKLGDWFKTSHFREVFIAKGRYRDYLNAIPTFVVTNPYPGFVGLKALVSA